MALSARERLYNRLFKKVINRVNKAISEGYIPNQYFSTLTPKTGKITKRDIDKLKSYTERKIKESRGTFYQTKTGEIVSGKEGAKLQRSESAKKGWQKRKPLEHGKRLYQGVKDIIAEGIQQAHQSNNENQAGRCYRLNELLEGARADDEERLYKNLAKAGEIVIEKAQLYCVYDDSHKMGHSEFDVAYITLHNIITGNLMTMEETQEFEDDYDEEEDE